MAHLVNGIVDSYGSPDDFIGHAGAQTFVVITYAESAGTVTSQLRQRFSADIGTHYNFLDSERGGIQKGDGSLAPIMALSFGIVSPQTHSFSDIREITEAAAEARRMDQESRLA